MMKNFRILAMLNLFFIGLLSVSTTLAQNARTHFSLTFSTESIQYVKDGHDYVVYYNATCSLANLRAYDAGIDSWTVEFTTEDDSLAEVASGSPSPTIVELCTSSATVNDSDGFTNDASVTIRGRFVGVTKMKAKLIPTSGSSKSQEVLDEEVEVEVLRNITNIGKILGYIIVALTVLNNLWWGTQFDFEEAKRLLRRPTAIILALGVQFIFMPSWAYAVGSMFHQPDGTLLAYLGVAAAHTSGPVHFLVLLTYGNVTLSLLINAFSVTLAFATMPWWMLTVGTGMFANISVPFASIGQNWGVFFCPWLGGMLLQYLVPKCKMPIAKILFPTNAIQLILSLVTGIITNYYQFRFWNATNVFNGMMIPYITLAVALLLAWGFGFSKPDMLSVGFTSPLKDAGLVIPIIHQAIHGPYADIWLAPVLVSSLVTPYVLIPYVLYLRCYRDKCRKAYLKRKGLSDEEEGESPKADNNSKEGDDNKVTPSKDGGDASKNDNNEMNGVENNAYDKTEL